MNKNERLIEAYKYLRSTGYLHTQKQLAEKMSATEGNVSKAFKGDDKVLTDSFIMRFCQAFPGTFNMDWLLHGDGDMLMIHNSFPTGVGGLTAVAEDDEPNPFIPPWADTLIGILSRQISENEALHAQLRQSINDVNDLKCQLKEVLNKLK
jgi:hypothetical protein